MNSVANTQRLERLTDDHYLLPRAGAMRADVHAFLSPALLAQTDEALWQQAAQAASYPGIVGLYLMPDTHLGYGIPVGGVAVTEDVIIQAGSGYDISCGVIYLQAPELHAEDVADEEKTKALDPGGRVADRDRRRQPSAAADAALQRAGGRGDPALRR